MKFDPVDFARFASAKNIDSESIEAKGRKGCRVGLMKAEDFAALMEEYLTSKSKEEKVPK
jgi:hypothetical protein